MNKKQFTLIIGISAVLGLATIALAAILWANFHLWARTLSSTQVRLLLPFFTAMSGVFFVIGVYARRRRKKIYLED
jgi:hypothetical protein